VSGSNGLFGGSTLKVFDVSSGNCLATFAQLRYDHKGSCSAVCMPSATRVITAATDATLAGWNCEISLQEKKPLLASGFFSSSSR
jgi:WD40 repeat protein